MCGIFQMKVEEVFQAKSKRGQIFKEWTETERGNDPLIKSWEKRKRKQSICDFEKHKS